MPRLYSGLGFRAAPPRYTPMHIGPIALPNNLFVAPMAGVTDRPFRQLCKKFGVCESGSVRATLSVRW